MYGKMFTHTHISISTIRALNEGTILLNKQRVTTANFPKFLKKWKKIWINEVEDMEFIIIPYASNWIGMNVLSVDPNTVIVDPRQTKLIKRLEREKFTVVPYN